MAILEKLEDFQNKIKSTTIYDYDFIQDEEFYKKFSQINKLDKEFVVFRKRKIVADEYWDLNLEKLKDFDVIDLQSLKLRIYLEDGNILTKKCAIKLYSSQGYNKFMKQEKYVSFKKFSIHRFPISLDVLDFDKLLPTKKIELIYKYGLISDEFWKECRLIIDDETMEEVD